MQSATFSFSTSRCGTPYLNPSSYPLWMALAVLMGFLALGATAGAQSAPAESEDALYMRVVDVGGGLCTIARIPGGHSLIYDAGHWVGKDCHRAALDILPQDDPVDLLVLSHSDGDHVGDADLILESFDVREIVRVGTVRESTSWKDADAAIRAEGAKEINLQRDVVPFGTTWSLGEAVLTLVGGWKETPADWKGLSQAEKYNAVSLVMRLDYGGRSILLTGDTIGRGLKDPDDVCEAAEAAMVANVESVPLRSDIILAPHHGGNNGSAPCFLEAVAPQYVIFSSGHKHHHPTQAVAQRYLDVGVPLEHVFRTDLGDDEGGSEWAVGRVDGHRDNRGDDDVEVWIGKEGEIEVGYRGASGGD